MSTHWYRFHTNEAEPTGSQLWGSTGNSFYFTSSKPVLWIFWGSLNTCSSPLYLGSIYTKTRRIFLFNRTGGRHLKQHHPGHGSCFLIPDSTCSQSRNKCLCVKPNSGGLDFPPFTYWFLWHLLLTVTRACVLAKSICWDEWMCMCIKEKQLKCIWLQLTKPIEKDLGSMVDVSSAPNPPPPPVQPISPS